jgi:putative tryptophan/tyrosine transport system substrate-binding protein
MPRHLRGERMQRRDFIGLVGSAAVVWPIAPMAQPSQKTRRIAFVHSGIPTARLTEDGGTYWIRMFYEELRRLGFAEGTNIVVERFSAEGSTAHFTPLAAEVARTKPDIIVANHNNLVRELMMANAATPIVAITTDPIATGLVTSMARPGGNVTGVSVIAGDGIDAKRVQFLKDAIPTATNITYLRAAGVVPLRLDNAIKIRALTEVTETQLYTAFAELADQRADAVLIGDSGSFLALSSVVVELAAKHRIPAIYPYRDFVEKGGLMAYAPDLGELAKRMASDVHQILGGAKPGDIPFYQPSKWELVTNLKAAQALELTLPLALLTQADEVIE